jgi:predicted pyridoxine 5'-phosphate oxidase superfamily flavin-nucleotide-binding protein
MTSTYHPGEHAVQALAGVRMQADRTGGMLRDTIPPAGGEFIARQPVVFLATAAEGRVWATAAFGTPGFARAMNDRSLRIDALPLPGDPAANGLHPGSAIGLLAIEPATRRRMRVNGVVDARGEAGFTLRTEQVYSNCPKYIQARDLIAAEPQATPGVQTVHHMTSLSPAQMRFISTADTFVIATAHPEAGADASHRGGLSGFVRVESDRALAIPDYSGNMMFQTLGNLAIDPRAGLLFLDFEHGWTLQIAGRAVVDWDPAAAATFAGAQRVVRFAVEDVVEITGATALRWGQPDFSPFNPG